MSKVIKRDVEATIAQHFLDPRSYVAPDGRWVLYGEDWEAQKKAVWIRGEGRCEKIVSSETPMTHAGGQSALRCRNEMADPHHKLKRSKKRDDRMENLIGLCRWHHDLAHPEKRPQWTAKTKPSES